jgi:hypothetical protein
LIPLLLLSTTPSRIHRDLILRTLSSFVLASNSRAVLERALSHA